MLSKKEALRTFEAALKDSGIGYMPNQTIGRQYQFISAWGALMGVITSIELTDVNELRLYVSNPRLAGENLLYLSYSDSNGWKATVDSDLYDNSDRDDTEVTHYIEQIVMDLEKGIVRGDLFIL